MGFMTEISILNDRWEEIRQNPKQFVEQIYAASAMSMVGKTPPYIIGQTTVVKTHHADHYRVYLSGHNSFIDIHPEPNATEWSLDHNLKSIKIAKDYIKSAEMRTKELLGEIKLKS